MKKRLIKFRQLPDPLSRFNCTYAEDVATISAGESTMDPYPYFYDPRYNVEIEMQNGDVFDNYERE